MAYSAGTKTDIVIDIETVVLPVTQSEIEEYMADYEPPGNYKDPLKIALHKEDAEKNCVSKILSEKRFSLEGKRMISAAAGIADHKTDKVTDIQSWGSDDLSIITDGLVQYINSWGQYRLVGFNINSFDLPEIVKSFWKTQKFPNIKPSKWDVVDLINTFKKGKLKNIAKAFGIIPLGLDGSAVDTLYHIGDWKKILEYNEDDVRITGELYIAASKLYSFS